MDFIQPLEGPESDKVYEAFHLRAHAGSNRSGFYFENGETFGVEVTDGKLVKRMTRDAISPKVEIIERVGADSVRTTISPKEIVNDPGTWNEATGMHVSHGKARALTGALETVGRALLDLQLPALFAAVANVHSDMALRRPPQAPKAPFLA